ncbi:hypothetical protein SP99_02016 [Enterobacter sp. BIDMC92]|nr:hypothetical protein SP99_02016 [Enterobacter sp. BIDMC92]
MALINNIKNYIEMLTNTKATMKAVVTDWNVCIEQSGADFLTFDFPVEGWTRKATLSAEFERVAVQLTNIMEGRDALEVAPERHKTMVQDIKKGDVVVNPVSGELNTVTGVDDFSCYFIILFSGDMVQQYFDRGETLMVCEAKPATQITNVIPSNEALNMSNFDRVLNIVVREGGVDADSMREHLESRATQEPLADAACTLLIHACGVPITDELRAELLAAAQ